VADHALAMQQAADGRRRRSLRDGDGNRSTVGVAVDLALDPEPGEGQQEDDQGGDRQEKRPPAPPALQLGERRPKLLVLEGVPDVDLVSWAGRGRAQGAGGSGHGEERSSQAWRITAAATLSTTRRRAGPERPSEESDRSAVTVVRRSS